MNDYMKYYAYREKGWIMKKEKVEVDPSPIEDMYGYFEQEATNVVAINVYGIWEDVNNDKRIKYKEDGFIRWFCKTVAHEYIHQQIKDVMEDLFEDGEEWVNTKMIGRIW